jgi:hypothetical protein
MKKILCVNNINIKHTKFPRDITIGEWYEVLSENDYTYLIIDDLMGSYRYLKSENNFKTERQIRKEKLQKINDKASK